MTEGRHTQVYPLKHEVMLHKARLAHSESREMEGTGKTPTTTGVFDYDACASEAHFRGGDIRVSCKRSWCRVLIHVDLWSPTGTSRCRTQVMI